MNVVGTIAMLCFIVLTAFLLIRKYNPQTVLIFSGLSMLGIALLLGLEIDGLVELTEKGKNTGFTGFDLFALIKESLSVSGARVGLLIMTVGGFAYFMNHIGASDAMVHVAMKPLSMFRKHPYLAASLLIFIGQLISLCISSATGLGLLLMASIYPIFMRLGMSRLTAVSVITACTAFDMGPASTNTLAASEFVGVSPVEYFLREQLLTVVPAVLVLMLLYFFMNRYFDKKNQAEGEPAAEGDFEARVPLSYAILPVLPLILLIVFSDSFTLLDTSIRLDTATAMIISVFTAIVFEIIRTRKIKEVFSSLKIFWEGMGKVFASVVTLFIAAGIFADGLQSLGFIDNLLLISQGLGFGFGGVQVFFTIVIFAASMLMGSGSAPFLAFGELSVPVAHDMGEDPLQIILPMQLASSMGRASSPISGVVIATSELARVSTFDVMKRNVIPLSLTMLFILGYRYLVASVGGF